MLRLDIEDARLVRLLHAPQQRLDKAVLMSTRRALESRGAAPLVMVLVLRAVCESGEVVSLSSYAVSPLAPPLMGRGEALRTVQDTRYVELLVASNRSCLQELRR